MACIPATLSLPGNTPRASLVYEAAVRAAPDGDRPSVFAADAFPEGPPPAHYPLNMPCVASRP